MDLWRRPLQAHLQTEMLKLAELVAALNVVGFGYFGQ
jgi:hypothetical protein